jgi:hypothetical protein
MPQRRDANDLHFVANPQCQFERAKKKSGNLHVRGSQEDAKAKSTTPEHTPHASTPRNNRKRRLKMLFQACNASYRNERGRETLQFCQDR